MMVPPERGGVDWDLVRRRIAAAAESGAADPDDVRRVLEERAARIAQPIKAEQTAAATEAVVFRLGRERYAVETSFVFSVFPLLEIAPVPGARPPLYGLTLWQGELITVLDLRGVLGISTASLSDLSRVILLGRDEPELAILADAVEGIRRFEEDDLHDTIGTTESRRYVRALSADAVSLLEATEVLTSLSVRNDV
jgi:purine-binding chemotaxis protein CheW